MVQRCPTFSGARSTQRCSVESNYFSFQIQFLKKKFNSNSLTPCEQIYIFIFLFICIFILLSRESDGEPYELTWELPAICLPHLNGGISFRVFPIGTTSELAGLLHTVPLMLNDKQESCKYPLLSHWFDRTQNQTPESRLPIQKQTLYPLGHPMGKLNSILP